MNVSPRVATAGLVVLAAVDVVLVGVALRSTTAKDIDTVSMRSTTPSKATTTGPVSPSPTPSPTSSASPSTKAPAAAVTTLAAPLQTMLVAVDDQRAWRATAGSCSAGGASLATTTDGGKTWVDAKTPLRSIVRVRPAGAQAAFVIGAGPSCTAELRSTTEVDGAWGPATSVASAWFRDPENPKVVGGPGASASQPCAALAVLDLVVLSSDSARVLCADGGVRSTTSSGSSWTASGEIPGAVALAVSSTKPAQTYIARLDAPDCAGVQVQRVDQSVATSCIKTKVPNDPGQIALSLVSGGGWLSIGDTTMRSTDDLATWRVS